MAFWNARGRALLMRTTVGTRADAERLARRLVEARLAACVHVGEAASVYRWEGKVRQETEFVVEARTDARRRQEAERAMLDGHPYEVPMVETVESTLGPSAYARWMAGELR